MADIMSITTDLTAANMVVDLLAVVATAGIKSST
jgi:hypothetical protein